MAFGCLCAAALVACSEGDTKKKGPPPPVPVTASTAVTRDIPITLQLVGRAEAFESVAIKSRIDGQVSEILFSEGQHVNQGDVLVRLDPADYAARLQQAEAAVARDAALIAKARADTARYVQLRERKFVSDEKVADIRTSESTTNANAQASKSAADLARLQLSYATIRAPITGVVGARLVFPGSTVKNNDTSLAVINRVQPLLVSFMVPEQHLPALRAALRESRDASAEMSVSVRSPSETANAYLAHRGKLRFIDNAVDATTGTILAKAELPNTDEALTPGQYLNVAIHLSTLKNAVVVPNAAVQQGSDDNYAYVVKDDSSVELRPLEVGPADGGITAVVKGLQAGETVVTDGQLRLEPGSKVKIKADDPTPPEANATPEPARKQKP